jgi:hypothetical protein
METEKHELIHGHKCKINIYFVYNNKWELTVLKYCFTSLTDLENSLI